MCDGARRRRVGGGGDGGPVRLAEHDSGVSQGRLILSRRIKQAKAMIR